MLCLQGYNAATMQMWLLLKVQHLTVATLVFNYVISILYNSSVLTYFCGYKVSLP